MCMLGDISVVTELYVVCGYTDMRKSIDGLCTIIRDQLHMEPDHSSALYLFCGKRSDRIKALLHESDGFVLLYKRLDPKHVGGSFKLRSRTNSNKEILSALIGAFEEKVDRSLLIRRLGVSAGDTRKENGMYQLDLFTDYGALDKERRLQRALIEVRQKYGPNALLRGFNYLEGGTARQRNLEIGGHKA